MKCTCCFQDKDWEVLERVLVNLPLLLQNKTLILSATHDLINSLCHQLCAMVRQNNRCHYKNLYFRLIQLHFIIKLVHFIFLGFHYDTHFVHPSSFYSFFCSSVFNELNKSGYYNICKFKIYFHNVFWGFQSLLFIDRNIKNKFYPISYRLMTDSWISLRSFMEPHQVNSPGPTSTPLYFLCWPLWFPITNIWTEIER